MRRRAKLLFILIIFVTLFSIPLYIEAANSVYFYSPYPNGVIGISKPEIGWTVFLGNNQVENVQFLLNNKPLSVVYDKQRETFYGKPATPLSGLNHVTAKVKLKNWGNTLEKSWTFTISNYSLSSFPNPDNNQENAINYANDYRYILGNPLYQFNPSLNMSAQKHANYQANLNTFSHYEEKGENGFFGTSVSDRANFYGFFGDVAEDISYQTNSSPQDAVDSLFDAPYHRIPFMIPSYSYYGYGKNNNYHVINFGKKNRMDFKWVSYPTPNQDSIPTYWENYETPDPLRFYEQANKVVGYPIMAGVFGKDVKNITLISAKLKDENNSLVPIYVNSPKETGGNDEELNNTVVILPRSILNDDKTYHVDIELEANLENDEKMYYKKSWSFKTAKRGETGRVQLHQLVNYPPFSKDTKMVQFRLGQRYMMVNQNGFPIDVVPMIENGRAMVPFRALGNTLGAYVSWDAENRTIIYKKDQMMIEMPLDKTEVKVNGNTIQLDQGAIIRNGRSYVPSRFISEQLGAQVSWIAARQEVLIQITN